MIQPSNAPTPKRSGFTQSGGLNIAFQVFDSRGTSARSPVILVHGWGADAKSNWVDSGWVTSLQQQHNVITIDVRGHGKSDKPQALEPFSYAEMSSDVLAVMDELDIQQCGLLGYSMGAFMGAYLLGHYSERFSAMILGGIGDETEESAAQGVTIAEALRAQDITIITNPYGKQVRSYVESNPDNDLESLACSALKMWPEGYPLTIAGKGIDNANLSVLIVNGANDHPYVDSADALAAALPRGRHLRIPERDHMTVVADQQFKQVALEFFAQTQQGR